jgi:hypothetical protein
VDEELYKDIIAAIYRIVGAAEKRHDDLRDTDREAVRLAHADLSNRLEGFPQLFATKEEVKSVSGVVAKLDKDSLAREIYEQNNNTLVERVSKLEREKLPRETFEQALTEWTIWRDTINAAGIATMARGQGGAATWKLIAAIIAVTATIVGTVVSLVVLFANNSI